MSASWRRLPALAILAGSLVIVAVQAGGDLESENCPNLGEDQFEAHLDKRRKNKIPSFVMFHVSWCKACQRAYPLFVAAADEAHEKGMPVDFAHVDCEGQKALCKRFGVKGYPSIKLFEVSKDTDDPRMFKGTRTTAGFLKYAERMTQPPVKSITSQADFEELMQNESFTAFIAASEPDTKGLAGLDGAADTWRDRHIVAAAPSLGAALPKGLPAPPADATFAVVSTSTHQWGGATDEVGKPAAVYYTGSLRDRDAVATWLENNRFPGVWRLHEANFFEFTHTPKKTVVLALNTAHLNEEVEEEFRRAAAKYSNDFCFGVVDGVEWTESLADFNIAKEDLPRFFVTEDNFEVWIEDIDELRPTRLEEGLENIIKGGPILRQSRSTWSKVAFYQREANRKAMEVRGFAARGAKETAIVVTLAVLFTLIALLSCRLLVACCRELFTDEYDAPPVRKHMKTH